MVTTIKAKFDGKHFLPETSLALECGRTYLLRVEELDQDSTKLAGLRQAMRNQAFLQDLEEVAQDFAALDAQD